MNYEFKNVFSKGKYYIEDQIIVYSLKNKLNYIRLGIAINSKLCNAVKRNKIKRLIRASYQNIDIKSQEGYDIVFIWNKKEPIEKASYNQIYNDMKKAFSKIGIIE